MVVAEFKNDNYTSVYGLKQWDFGQELLIKGTGIQGKTVEVHFALERDDVALRMLGTVENGNITVLIPDTLLQVGNSIYAYVYQSGETAGKTTHKIFMHVSPRAKPEDYTEKEFKNALQQVLTIAQSVREDADAGKFNATDEQVRTAVNAYMEENPVAITVDKTLTQSDKAADAKATGDKFLQYAIKNTVTGESPVAITDSAEEKLQDLKLFGKSEQTQDPPPSPDNHQEIKNVGKWNEGTGKYEVDIKVTNAKESWDKEQTITITSDRPITKWDKLVEQDGQIGWLYKSQIIDRLDGKSNKISIANKKGEVQNFAIQFENVPNGNGNSDIFVDKYRAVQLSYIKAEYGICCNWNDGVKYFSAPNENVATVDEFKEWLVENPLKIAYETTKTEFVPLQKEEQDAIRNIKTYYPTTVITVNGGEVNPDIEVSYIADTKNYVDRKIKETVSVQTQNAENILSLMPESVQATMIEKDTNKILEREVTR